MALDYLQIQEQVRQLGENASSRAVVLGRQRDLARQWLEQESENLARLAGKVEQAARSYDPSLRCAKPALRLAPPQYLTASFPLPALPERAVLVAADGSQAAVDRHAEVAFCLINVGAVRMRLGEAEPPEVLVHSRLLYDAELLNPSGGLISDGQVALRRDSEERMVLAQLVEAADVPVVTLTDGPVELWGAKSEGEEAAEFREQLAAYKASLLELMHRGAIAAGYVDKPTANLVVRLLEVAMTPESELPEIHHLHPLLGATDRDLYQDRLQPGERSAVFVMQSQSARMYEGELEVHFFYLNVGRAGKPWLARVEVPAWVAQSPAQLDVLHAVLVDQCRVLGARHYPYLLHRAHETALVTFEERDQVIQMIVLELRRREIEVDSQSQKQGIKGVAGRTSYK
jgi:hypothetical protein